MTIRHSELLPVMIVALAAGLAQCAAAPQTALQTFPSSQAVAEALLDAALENDTQALLNQDWLLPMPLAHNASSWSPDLSARSAEIMARHIERNELAALEACHAYVEAQKRYARRPRSTSGLLLYAQRIVSSPGKDDGLYEDEQSASLTPDAFAAAAFHHAPYDGYYYRILKSQGPDALEGEVDYVVAGEMIGGFALIAWPAEYGVTGVQTLIVNHMGIVYSKDLGPETAKVAAKTMTFNPDESWTPVSGK